MNSNKDSSNKEKKTEHAHGHLGSSNIDSNAQVKNSVSISPERLDDKKEHSSTEASVVVSPDKVADAHSQEHDEEAEENNKLQPSVEGDTQLKEILGFMNHSDIQQKEQAEQEEAENHGS